MTLSCCFVACIDSMFLLSIKYNAKCFNVYFNIKFSSLGVLDSRCKFEGYKPSAAA